MSTTREWKWMIMMLFCIQLYVQCSADDDILNWTNDDWVQSDRESKLYRRSTESQLVQQTDEIQGRNYAVHENMNYAINDTDIGELIDQIINSRREGRNLNEYNELYADGNIDEALMQGNDMEARNLVRDKLCSLGLLSCDVDGKRPLYSTIYAQRPPQTNRYGGGPYGPAKPMHLADYHKGQTHPHSALSNKFGPPRKVGYAGPFKPSYANVGPIYAGQSSPPPSNTVNFNKPLSGSAIYGNKPLGPPWANTHNNVEPVYLYEKPEFGNSQQASIYNPEVVTSPSTQHNIVLGQNAQNGIPNNNLQQHVHHHYHHLENGVGAQKLPGISIPSPSTQNIKTDFSTLAQSSAAFTTGFNDASQNVGSQSQNFKPNSILGNSYASNFNPVNPNPMGASYHTQNPNYYKKELHNVDGISATFSNFNTLTSGYAPQNGVFDTSRNQFVNCQCVPIHQCAAADRIGRKEDLILPIDPRNLGTNIDAINDDNSSNTTTIMEMTSPMQHDNHMSEDHKVRNKRDAEEKQSNETNDLHLDSEGHKPPSIVSDVPFVQRNISSNDDSSFILPHTNSDNYQSYMLKSHYPVENPNFDYIKSNDPNPLIFVQTQQTQLENQNFKPLIHTHVISKNEALSKMWQPIKPQHIETHNIYYNKYHERPLVPYAYRDVIASAETQKYSSIPKVASTSSVSIETIPIPSIYEYHSTAYHVVHSMPTLHEFSKYYNKGNKYPIENEENYHVQVKNENYNRNVFMNNSNSILSESGYSPADLNRQKYFSSENNYKNDNITFPTNRSTTMLAEIDHANSNITQKNFPALQQDRYQQNRDHVAFPHNRKRRHIMNYVRRAYYGAQPQEKTCRINEICCRRPLHSSAVPQFGRCGVRNAAGITGRIKTPIYVDGNSEFAEYPWHVAILKKDPKESVYACGGTLIDSYHVITAAHCIKSQNGYNLKARLGEWDVNNDVEFFPYIERDVISVHIHPEYYAGTLDNDLAILKLDHPVDFNANPHISPACLPDKYSDYTGARCWTTGWGKDAFGEQGKYQNILKEVDVPILSNQQCEVQLRHTRLGYDYKLNPGFLCAGGEDGKDACKGDGGGPLVCERNGIWNVIGVVSWGIGCGQINVPGVYVRVSHYLDWIQHITQYNK